MKSLVSDVDYQFLLKINWYFSTVGYVRNNEIGQMHRIVFERKIGSKIPHGYEIDHINRDKLDNRRSNLRLATHSQNAVNYSHGTRLNEYRGIAKHRNKWTAKIQKDGKKIYIGIFNTPESASHAYEKMATKLFGKFAYKQND